MKIKNYEDAEKQLKAAKEKSPTLLEDLQATRKENKIAKDTEPGDVTGKGAKPYKKAFEAYHANKTLIDECKKFMSENKPKKEKKERETKYNYPAGMSSEEKKKFRTAQRAAAKKADKEKNNPKKADKKPDKKVKKEDKKVDKKVDKKKDKKKVKKAAAPIEDKKKEAEPEMTAQGED